jgi:uncharacterized protein YndB with AHSA1/START domain
MGQFTVSRQIDAPVERVWAVLDDFGDIQRWNPGVTASQLTTEGAVGTGSERVCELKPVGTIKERITQYEPGERMTIHIYEMSKLPLKEGIADFSLASKNGGTEVTIDYRYTASVRLMDPFMKKPLTKGLGGLLKGLEVESEKVAPG